MEEGGRVLGADEEEREREREEISRRELVHS